MFYSHNILQKRGGKFGVVWIAATGGKGALTKRDYAGVNIRRTCEELEAYIMRRFVAAKGRRYEPLSLYLSAQLMFGVVKVYGKQNDYLADEARSLNSKVTKSYDTTGIDLREKAEHLELLQDPGFDPDFEFMRADIMVEDELMPLEPELAFWKTTGPADITLPQFSPKSPVIPFRAGDTSFLTSPKHLITMLDVPERSLRDEIPGEVDLPPLDAEGKALLEGVDMSAESATEDVPQIDEKEELLREAAEKQRHRTPQADITLPTVDAALLEQRDRVPRQRGKSRRQSSDTTEISPQESSPEPGPRSKRERLKLAFELSPLEPSPTTKRIRRRQLLFADQEMQLNREQIKKNIRTSTDLCQPMVLPVCGKKARLSAAQLMKRPGRQDFLNKGIHYLWQRNCKSTKASRTDEQLIMKEVWTVSATSSDSDAPVDITLDVEKPVGSADAEESAQERMRDVSHEQSRDISQMSGVSFIPPTPPTGGIDLSKREGPPAKRQRVSQASVSDEEISLRDDLQEPLFEHTRSSLADLPEEPVFEEMPDVVTTMSPVVESKVESEEGEGHRSPRLLQRRLSEMCDHGIRLIDEETKDKATTTFKEICPTSNTRSHAAMIFMAMLELAKLQERTEGGQQKVIEVHQQIAFGSIYIKRGSAFPETTSESA